MTATEESAATYTAEELPQESVDLSILARQALEEMNRLDPTRAAKITP